MAGILSLPIRTDGFARSRARISYLSAWAYQAYGRIEPIVTKMAAHVDGVPCCAYIGPEGAGHYVKMVHNGIEYADMQLIAEAYDLLKTVYGLDAATIAGIFDEWKKG
jgi:6-phosphogluconate dehydrogenase